MNEFEKFVLDWYIDYLRDNQDNKEAMLKLYNAFSEDRKYDKLKEYPSDDDHLFEVLENINYADVIYSNLFYYRKSDDSNIPNTDVFLRDILGDVVHIFDLDMYNFCDDFIEIIINEIMNYDKPKSFFEDLQYGGCVAGLISDFIYNSDCLDFYKKYANDLECFKENLEDEYGMEIKQKEGVYYYVWIVWLSFEEFCSKLYNYLF